MQRHDVDLVGPEPKNPFNRPITAGADPCTVKPKNCPPATCNHLSLYKLSIILQPLATILQTKVQVRWESGNWHENDDHRVYGRYAKKDKLNILMDWERGF